MQVAVQIEFKADRKEPLGVLLRRIAALFASNGLEPEIEATFSDGPAILRRTSAVERALKKHPHLALLERNDAPVVRAGLPSQVSLPPVRRLANAGSPNPFPLADVIALADGVPRSLPFHAVHVSFRHAAFGTVTLPFGLAPRAGVDVGDGWWTSGRIRSVHALYAVEGAAGAKALPDPPAPVAAVLAGIGKTRSRSQFVEPAVHPAVGVTPGTALAGDAAIVYPLLLEYKKDLPSIVQRIGLPHDLPPAAEVRLAFIGASGPLKPTLVAAFKPRGYDCRGDSGTFTLRRRTSTNHVVDIELDVGTWSRSVTFTFGVSGPSFNAMLTPPVTARDVSTRYPIGDTANWEKIVANIAAIVDELERTFVAEITAAVEPAPAWFEPGR